MTVQFPYDLHKVSLRTAPVCRRKKSQGDGKECKHIRRSLRATYNAWKIVPKIIDK